VVAGRVAVQSRPEAARAPVTVAPLAWLVVVAVVLTVAGLAGFRRRDLM
jgi:putative exporter of polyketide antibiotics